MQFLFFRILYIYVRRKNRYIYMGTSAVNSIGQDPRLMNVLFGRYTKKSPVEKIDGGIQTQGATGFTPTVDHTSPNLFAGNLTGINTNIGIGDYQDGQEQAGRKQGGKTIAFA